MFSHGRCNDISVDAHALKIDGATAVSGLSRLTTRVKDNGLGRLNCLNHQIDIDKSLFY